MAAGDGHGAVLRHHRQRVDLQRGEPGHGMEWGTLRAAGSWTANGAVDGRNPTAVDGLSHYL